MRTQYDPVLGAGNSKIWMIEGLKTGQLDEFAMFDDQTIGSQPVCEVRFSPVATMV